MCECGCGDMRPYKNFKIGRNTVLTTEVYPGCEECDTGIMVTLYKFTPAEAREWDITEFAQFDDFGMFNIPLLGKEDLIEAFAKLNEEEPVEQYDSMTDWLEDHGVRLLQEALWIRLGKNRKEEEKQAGKMDKK